MGLCQTKPTFVDPNFTYLVGTSNDMRVRGIHNTFDIYGDWLPTKKSTSVTFTFPCGTIKTVLVQPYYQCSSMKRRCILRGESPTHPPFDGDMVEAMVSVGTCVNIPYTYRHEGGVTHC